MSVKLITYDLNSPGQKHAKVLAKIKDDYPAWAKLSESSYAVNTTDSPSTIFNAFRSLLDDNDYFLCITLSRPYAGRNSKDVIDWLDTHL